MTVSDKESTIAVLHYNKNKNDVSGTPLKNYTKNNIKLHQRQE